jgi:hypothetical protein
MVVVVPWYVPPSVEGRKGEGEEREDGVLLRCWEGG